MRILLFTASIAALIAVTMTTEAAQRKRSRGAVTSRARDISNSLPNVEVQEAPKYLGFSVEPELDAKGEDLEFQQAIAAQLSLLDYVPDYRVEHFRWISDELVVPIQGWRGRIVSADPIADGACITVRVVPIAGIGTKDHTLEYYLYVDGRLTYIASDGTATRGVTTFN